MVSLEMVFYGTEKQQRQRKVGLSATHLVDRALLYMTLSTGSPCLTEVLVGSLIFRTNFPRCLFFPVVMSDMTGDISMVSRPELLFPMNVCSDIVWSELIMITINSLLPSVS